MIKSLQCLKCRSKYRTSYQGKKPVCAACRKHFENGVESTVENKIKNLGSNSFATKKTNEMGKLAEKKFFIFCSKYPFMKLRNATKYEELIYHYDYVLQIILNNEFKYFRIEVKSMKSRKRGEKQDPNIIFLEYKNIDGGLGWLYGSSDYIAFEQDKFFILFPRVDLVKFAEIKRKTIKIVKNSGIVNTLYSRKNRKDLVGCFSLNEIKEKCTKFHILN